MSVKDKENQAPYNLWSGGDYTQNTNDIRAYTGLDITVSSDYSSNYKHSFKLTTTTTRASATCFNNHTITSINSATLTFDVNWIQGTAHFNIRSYEGQTELNRVLLVINQTGHYTLTLTPPENAEKIEVLIVLLENTSFYLDNITLIESKID